MSGVRWMYHATAMGASYDAILEPLVRLFGCRVLHDAEVATPGIERRGGMTWIADGSIEIGEPLGAGSPVHRFVDRFGGGMHSVAVQVDDLEAALAHAATHGVRVADRITPFAAFTRPVDTAGLLIEWNDGGQDDDPRWGAPTPDFTRPPVIAPRSMAFVAAVVADPLADARFLGEILATNVVELSDRGSPDEPASAIDLGDCMLALYPLPSPADSAKVWGAVHPRPRCVALGLLVDDLDEAVRALDAAGVGVHHTTGDGSLVLAGADLPFPVVLTGRLLPGDPRIA